MCRCVTWSDTDSVKGPFAVPRFEPTWWSVFSISFAVSRLEPSVVGLQHLQDHACLLAVQIGLQGLIS